MMTDVDMIQAMARAIAPDRWFIYDHEHICNPEWANTRVALSRLQATVALTVIQPELDRLRAEIKVLTEINVNLVAERDERLKAADETIDRLRAENTDLIHRVERAEQLAYTGAISLASIDEGATRPETWKERAENRQAVFLLAKRRAEAAESEAAALREALEPFAEAATKGEIGGYPPNYFVGATEFENARRARAALEGRDV